MTTREGAERILAHIEAIYQPQHAWASVRETDFGHLDLAFYRKTQRLLEEAGFVHLEDCEDLTIERAPANMLQRVLVRVLVSRDGTITAALYHPKLKSVYMRVILAVLGKRLGRITDFETEFTDGSFICTTNAMAAQAITLPDLIESEFLPVKTPPLELLERHRARVSRRIERSGLQARAFRTVAETRASQHRMEAIKAAFRGEIGGITREELETLSNAKLAAEVHAEIRRLRPKPQ